MFNFLNNNFEVRCGKGCEEAYNADIKSIRKNIEDIMLQYNCKKLDVYHWDNYLINPCDNLPNMMQNSNGYDLCNTYVYNNTSHEVNINTKLSVKKKGNKMHVIFTINSIRIIIEPDYTENEKEEFVNFLRTINLKEVSRDNKHSIFLKYNPNCFTFEYQNNLKQTFSRDFNIEENKIHIVAYDGKFVNLISNYNLTSKFRIINNSIYIDTPIKNNQKVNCPERNHEYIITEKKLLEIKDTLLQYLNNNNLIA